MESSFSVSSPSSSSASFSSTILTAKYRVLHCDLGKMSTTTSSPCTARLRCFPPTTRMSEPLSSVRSCPLRATKASVTALKRLTLRRPLTLKPTRLQSFLQHCLGQVATELSAFFGSGSSLGQGCVELQYGVVSGPELFYVLLEGHDKHSHLLVPVHLRLLFILRHHDNGNLSGQMIKKATPPL